jgi:hypothetical protein
MSEAALPSSSFMKYSYSCIVISSLIDSFPFSLGLCISIPPSLCLFPLSLSPFPPSAVYSSLYISLCNFFSFLGIYFCRSCSSSILSTPLPFLLQLFTFFVPPLILPSCPFCSPDCYFLFRRRFLDYFLHFCLYLLHILLLKCCLF